MLPGDTTREKLSKKFGDFVSEISGDFMNVMQNIKSGEPKEITTKLVESIFKKTLNFSRNFNDEIEEYLEGSEKLREKIEYLTEENRKLEVLYLSGIQFLSDIELKVLMQKAVETVVKELKADEGFIIITDENAEIDSIFAKNIDPEVDTTAKDLSTSVIKNSLENLKPVSLNDIKSEQEFSKRNSVVSLGLSAVICVPLISGSLVLGAVYLDRRNKQNPFSDNDLKFLISFAKQIVKGLEITMEISSLEQKLVKKSGDRFNTLRSEFKCDDIVGESKEIFSVLNLASKLAKSEIPVLLLGENGTGKELIARAIHNNSTRSNGPFVALNCAAIPEELLESELFGYEEGAFTGAKNSKPGKIETADGGTLFLDEIGDLSLTLQAKLLRVLQTKELERLGSTSSRKIDMRIISATNQNLAEMVKQKKFREDLYYRIKVMDITIPPLRKRKDDIESLVEFMIEKYSDGEQYEISPKFTALLEAYDWPGNIRELENVVQRSIALAKNNYIDHNDLPDEISEIETFVDVSENKTLEEAEKEFRRSYLKKVINQSASKAEAAEKLGINRSHLHKLIAQLDI